MLNLSFAGGNIFNDHCTVSPGRLTLVFIPQKLLYTLICVFVCVGGYVVLCIFITCIDVCNCHPSQDTELF